ncbi:MAG: hypothetical protein U1E05_03105, partial [Patescibacteria group bacterium]|nr:hypothetical protein [Patescibacteria group bacterium]
QAEALEQLGREIDATADKLEGDARQLFVVNLMVQQRMMLGLLQWSEGVLDGVLAFQRRDWAGGAESLRRANTHMDAIQQAQALASFGIWEHWYRGERKMNLARGREIANEMADKAEAEGKAEARRKTP